MRLRFLCRGVAKFGIALGSGPRGPGFESRRSDHLGSIEKSMLPLILIRAAYNA